MSSTALAERAASPTVIDPAVVERVLIHGDLRQLTPAQKVSYYKAVCESVGLNPLTQPFQYIVLNGKEVLYAKREATEQLRQLHDVSINPATFTREVIEGCYVVTAPASMPSGRTDVSTGAVAIDGLKGEARANAMMKAETKAKRRVTLSICGLGMLDETEIETIPGVIVHGAPPVRLNAPPQPEKPDGFDDWWSDLQSVADNGETALRLAWKESSKERRAYLLATNREGWDGLKAKAALVNTEDPF
jgi:hypothetical protein